MMQNEDNYNVAIQPALIMDGADNNGALSTFTRTDRLGNLGEFYRNLFLEMSALSCKNNWKNTQGDDIMTWLLKIMHRPCYEQLHVRTTFSLWNGIVWLCRKNCASSQQRLVVRQGRVLSGISHWQERRVNEPCLLWRSAVLLHHNISPGICCLWCEGGNGFHYPMLIWY